jgi:DNA polymerase phi
VVDNSQVQGSASGQEERDMLFAQLFGFTSIIRSGLLVRTVPLPSSPSFAPAASDLDSYDAVVSHLVTLGNKKSWLRESAWWTISLAIDAVHRSSVPWKERAIQNTIETLLDVNTTWSSDKVAAALQLKSLYPELDWNKRLSPTFKHGEILHGSNLTTLARILKVRHCSFYIICVLHFAHFTQESDDSSLDDVEKGIKTVSSSGTWKAQAHYVWDILLDHVLSGTPSGRHNTSIQDFFRIVVDGTP